jgi:hypothetical protein
MLPSDASRPGSFVLSGGCPRDPARHDRSVGRASIEEQVAGCGICPHLRFANLGNRKLDVKGFAAGCIELRVRRVILTERSEFDSESRRQEAVFIVQSTGVARHQPLRKAASGSGDGCFAEA